MVTKFMEVTNDELNWGKFCFAQFDAAEYAWPSAVADGRPLLTAATGANPRAIWILDLQTREGASFVPGGVASADLEKHRIWVCPMFEPMLEWFYRHPEYWTDVTMLPDHVDIPDAEFRLCGHRRRGPEQTAEEGKAGAR